MCLCYLYKVILSRNSSNVRIFFFDDPCFAIDIHSAVGYNIGHERFEILSRMAFGFFVRVIIFVRLEVKKVTLTQEDLHAIASLFNDRFDGIDARFDGIDARLDGMDARLDGMDARLDGMDARLDSMSNDIKVIKVDILENNVIPRLEHIEQCYLDASGRYINSSDKFDDAIDRIDTLEKVVLKHSEQIHELQLKQA